MAGAVSARRVLVLSLVFPPDGVSTAQLLGELVEDLVRQEREVIVVTTIPHYNPPAQWTARRRFGGLVRESSEAGATVFHLAMPAKSGSVAMRILAWLMFHALSVVVAGVLAGDVDIVLAPSPPLSIGVAAWAIGRLKGAPYIYNVQELYPDAAVALGVIRDGLALRLLRAMEAFVYRHAYAVVVIAPGMRDRIMRRGLPGERVRLIPNFVDTGDIAPRPKRNPFSKRTGLADRFVVMYAGNMGRAQQLGTVLDAAELLRDRPEVVFAFVGEGVEAAGLRASASALGLSNVVFVPQQPFSEVPDIYGASDLCVVPLLGALAFDAVPSKVYRIMAAARQVLAITALESDLARVVHESGGGMVVPPAEPAAIAAAITRAVTTPFDGESARQWVMRHVDRSVITARYGALLDEASAP